MSGAFVVFEGGEGAGKSTQAVALADALRARGVEVVLTREPGGTAVGEQIRSILLGAGSGGMAARTEALLFAAARAEHAAKVLRPGRERGAVIICDRYIDSSVAYQGAARELGAQDIAAVSMWATEGLLPDLTVLLDVDPGTGLGRAAERNRMEDEPVSFHDAVRGAFLARCAADPARYLVVAADRPFAEIAQEVLVAVDRLLARRDAMPAVPAGPEPAEVSATVGQPGDGRLPLGQGADR